MAIYQAPISQLFGVLAGQIDTRVAVWRRIAGKFDLIRENKGASLDAFFKRNNLDNNGMWLDYPLFTKIDQGIGIFSLTNVYRVTHLGISLYTLEHITTKPLTKDLNI